MKKLNLIQKIIIGILIGILCGLLLPQATFLTLIGNVFVESLKAIAPLLVFFIVISALAQHRKGNSKSIRLIVMLYILGTFTASLIAVIISFMFPVSLTFATNTNINITAPEGISVVLQTIVLNLVENPITSLSSGNYIGILFWSILFGIALQQASSTTKELLHTISEATSKVVRWIIQLAPIGIAGLVYQNIVSSGISIFISYAHLLLVLVGSMLLVALVFNPLLVFLMIRQNPYPLVFKCLKVSGITAFFTRSSAANIPVNMELCRELNLNEDIYSVSIPLGATINMAGAAITINVLALATVHTLGIQVDFVSAFVLSVLATISACGASGVAGGSLLLVPLACSLFGISNDIALQVVGIGFVIGVVQDAFETALNSSTDVLFTAAAEMSQWKKEEKFN